MKILKKILLALIVILVLFQLVPRPPKNISESASANDISTVHNVPAEVQQILKTSCTDCHSNNTVYPWYSKIQPLAMWLGNHVNEGKHELNFSEFAQYPLAKQYHKLDEINEQVKEGEMPLSSYTVVHTDAKLSPQQKLVLANWTVAAMDAMKAKYPADSLIMKKSN